MSTAFDLLREAREQHHLSLSDVADATLINIDYLRAIEQGRLDVLPQPYVRAFMREYAGVVGLDPAALMQKLDRDQAAAAAPPPAPGEAAPEPEAGRPDAGLEGVPAKRDRPEAGRDAGPARTAEGPPAAPAAVPTLERPLREGEPGAPAPAEAPPRDLSRYTGTAVVIVAVAIAAVILWNILGRDEPVAPERPFHEVVRENERLAVPDSTGMRPGVRPDSTPAAAGDSLTLVAQASDSVWVRMMRDDGLIRDYFFKPGESMTWHAREQFLFFTIGNPGAFTLKLNGQPLVLPGPPGRPLQHIVIRSTGITAPGSSTR